MRTRYPLMVTVTARMSVDEDVYRVLKLAGIFVRSVIDDDVKVDDLWTLGTRKHSLQGAYAKGNYERLAFLTAFHLVVKNIDDLLEYPLDIELHSLMCTCRVFNDLPCVLCECFKDPNDRFHVTHLPKNVPWILSIRVILPLKPPPQHSDDAVLLDWRFCANPLAERHYSANWEAREAIMVFNFDDMDPWKHGTPFTPGCISRGVWWQGYEQLAQWWTTTTFYHKLLWDEVVVSDHVNLNAPCVCSSNQQDAQYREHRHQGLRGHLHRRHHHHHHHHD
ncbi:hypothetical protein QBC38DRAFT_439977 [Podospora fimiseda]|uniref:Uncharacterized protein n=1 Tax=Podospora fimiseda TaxID=252190 RepID=A0AAN7BXQ8_9PEZI|nr:hypothetical protein QBC38DRAFT_439977 [Podospora fimiseda]